MARQQQDARKRKTRVRKIGEIRQSQALLTFGIGAVVDFQFHSAMPLGMDHWPSRDRSQILHEPDLETLVGKVWFQAPPVADEDNIFPTLLPAVRFPQWLYCPKCHALGIVREIFTDAEGAVPRHGPQYAFECIDGGKPLCTRCKEKSRGTGVPTRLVVVCYHDTTVGPEPDHPGHIDDFPWFRWAHQEKTPDAGSAGIPHYLELRSMGGSLAIDDLVVSCTCQASKSLRGVFGKDALRGITRCRGWRPWIESRGDSSGCDRPLKVFLRGATNLHLPVTTSVISIPPHTSEFAESLDEHVEALREAWELDCEQAAEQDRPEPEVGAFAKFRLKKLREAGFDRDREFRDEDCISSIVERITGSAIVGKPARTAPTGRRYAECVALRQGEKNPRGNFDARIVDPPPAWSSSIERVVKVHRLREVTALQGFRRITRDNPEVENSAGKYAPLSRNPEKWLPAIELRGEGIFLELNLAKLREWEGRPAVTKRMAPLVLNYSRLAKEEGWEAVTPPSPRLILVHTFAHLLIRQLTLECGYSSASLRERIYVATPEQVLPDGPAGEMAGCLIYTSTTDSDGSLGGLVRMGDPDRLEPVLKEALRLATWCSSDPVCATISAQGYKGLNRAACHACSLVPETSCERSNRYLDRVL
ncbi:MAG: DUF1998 domain-containing protein, partial [Planctomycetota bacterium]|nr:DUF1998 domain-containing protein [Planctomycetota bacterium]